MQLLRLKSNQGEKLSLFVCGHREHFISSRTTSVISQGKGFSLPLSNLIALKSLPLPLHLRARHFVISCENHSVRTSTTYRICRRRLGRLSSWPKIQNAKDQFGPCLRSPGCCYLICTTLRRRLRMSFGRTISRNRVFHGPVTALCVYDETRG